MTAVRGVQRIRIRLRREQKARLLSQLEQVDLLRKTIKQLNWPVVLGTGKRHPMRVSFGPAISVGHESEAEYCDVELAERVDLVKAKQELDSSLPEGYGCVWVKHVPLLFPSLEELLNTTLYRVDGLDPAVAMPLLSARLNAPEFLVVRKTMTGDQVIDAKPLVKQLDAEGASIRLVLRFGPKRTLKPERILQTACQLDDENVQVLRVCRAALYMEKPDGTLVEP